MYVDCPFCDTTGRYVGPVPNPVMALACAACGRAIQIRSPAAEPQRECVNCEPVRQGRPTTYTFGTPALTQAMIPCARCGKPFRGWRAPLAAKTDWVEPPYRRGERMEFGLPPVQVLLRFASCDACKTRLAISRDYVQGGLTCGACGQVFEPRLEPNPERVSWRVVRTLFTDDGVGVPVRAPVSSAWLERDNPGRGRQLVVPLEGECWLDLAGNPLTQSEPWTFHVFPSAEGWKVGQNDSRSVQSLQSGSVLGNARFAQGRALPADVPPEVLCASPEDDGAWQVWTDELLERGSPLGRLLRGMAVRPEARDDQLGLLEPFVRRQFAQVQWNNFGFVRSLQLEASLFSQHVFLLEPARVPAVAVLATLIITVDARSAADALSALIRARVPRSLRRVRLLGARVELGGIEGVLDQLRQDAPWLETTPGSLWG